MDLADLLAREGYAETDLRPLLAWARTRASVLAATVAADSPLRPLLDGGPIEHAPRSMSSGAAPVASAPAPAAEEGAPMELRRAVTAATAPHPTADDDAESGLGGFARFGGIVRMNRPYPFRDREEPAEERPTLARSFALAAERAAEDPPEPPPPPAAPVRTSELTGTLPQALLSLSAEESGGLVVGIPDEDTSDVPVPRTTSASSAHRRSSGAIKSGALVTDDDDVLASAVLADLAAPGVEEPALREPPPTRAHVEAPAAVDLRRPIPAGEAAPDAAAPVLRQQRGPKKRVVELGAPVARARTGGSGSTGKAVVVQRSGPVPQPAGRRPPPPPPPGRRPVKDDDDIQELSRVEVLDELPAYLRDDEE